MNKLIFIVAVLLTLIISEVSWSQKVDFAVFRLDYESFEITGVSTFSQDYRKTLPGPHQHGNIFFYLIPPGDFGYTKIVSRLTGEMIFHATTIWMGQGSLLFPFDFTPAGEIGYMNADPDTVIYLYNYHIDPSAYQKAWEKVKTTGSIRKLSSEYGYEAVVFPQIYGAGGSLPNPEWIVIAWNIPPAPEDAGIVEITWPHTTHTIGIPAQPELLIYNYSNEPVSLKAKLSIKEGGRNHSAVADIQALPSDSFYTVYFDCFIPQELNSYLLSFDLLDNEENPLNDSFKDNNQVSDTIQVTKEPVFRKADIDAGITPYSNNKLIDFDGDGDMDIIQWDYNIEYNLIRNDGNMTFIPEKKPALIVNQYTREIISADYTGNGHPDLLAVSYEKPPVLLEGNGNAEFKNITDDSGLNDLVAYGDVKNIDLENDGDVDLIFQSNGQEIVMRNDGSGKFSDFTAEAGVVDQHHTSGISVGDLNNDEYSDLVIANWNAPSAIFINDKTGHFKKLQTSWDFIYSRGAMILDFDDDGNNDILFYRQLYEEGSLLYKNTGSFTSGNPFLFFAGLPKSFHADAADINGDGFAEILIDNRLFSYQNNQLRDITNTLNGNRIEGGVFTDINGDNETDIFYQGFLLNQKSIVCNNFVVGEPAIENHMPISLYIYPNPMKEHADIHYTLNEPAKIRIDILDINGKVLDHLYNGNLDEGKHTTRWFPETSSGASLLPGVYIVRISAGNSCYTKKLVLLN